MKHELYILGARRTPVGTFMGTLKNFSPVDLGVVAAKAALSDAKVSGDQVAHSIFGNVCSISSPDGIYLARHIALKAGVKISSGSLTVNRLCGSGFEALVQAQLWVDQGPVLVGGAENMSLTPLIIRGVREGFKFSRPPATIDSLWESLMDAYIQMPMGQTAEVLAKEYEISRDDCDRWALLSHQRASKQSQSGALKAEIVSVDVDGKLFDSDEHIRHDANLEKMTKLKPVFGGVTTAANASGMNDAAAALIVADARFTESWKKTTGLKPMARVVASSSVGCDPKRMGIGPVAAIQNLCSETGWKLKDIPYVEVNEAFAAQVLSVKKALQLSDEQLNPHGSGISLGHPLGATGARISTHIAHLLASRQFPRAIGSACIGGGQGIAIAFEAL